MLKFGVMDSSHLFTMEVSIAGDIKIVDPQCNIVVLLSEAYKRGDGLAVPISVASSFSTFFFSCKM